jgi:ubiquinone/menaquinone biosynthesis C-methylase UbiE
MDPIKPTAVPAERYTREYYADWMEGHEEFRQSSGDRLPLRLQIPFDMAHVGTDTSVLDIGCGRGELALHCARRGAEVWGIDYATAAVALAREALANAPPDVRSRIHLRQADARWLPFDDASMDITFMLDVVEHLDQGELDQALREAWRVLKPDGTLIVHTMPNLWYYHVGYPLYRLIQLTRGQRLPADPRDRWPFKEVHVNEQTPWSLYQTLRRNGFGTRVWLKSTQKYTHETNRLVRYVMQTLVSAPLLRLIFCNDLFAVARKPALVRREGNR